MSAPNDVIDLICRFQDQYDSYHSPSYNETQLRREFVDPFVKALGWDVDNEQGYAEAYKDVIHEDSIKVGGATKAPDYSFRIGGIRKFFVETKKPSVNIRQDVSPAFQLRRYAWSARLPLSILTDFEEFAVYDCRIRPEKNDKASKARTLYVTYEEYDARWDQIAGIFSRNAILKGSFDKYAASTKKKHGTAEVDDAFLTEIEQWRSDLARNLALRNPTLSQRELNVAVQKTIDRIIFLRICEDRGIEQYGQLQSLLNGQKVYARLCELFRRADERYNSGLFHFSSEKDRSEPPDEWTLELAIDDRVLKDIIRRLYYPESPYEFSVLGADILGQVYEQFLGKVIRLTKGHQAKVEDKPEVKKAGGVYYTPTYIVDYIVAQTVGKLLEDKQPHEIAGRTEKWNPSKNLRPLAALDPACGSGSFLIGAYQYLLDWYRDWYVDHDPKKFKDRIYQTRSDQWRLTTAERKRVLLDHIYGVDIDPQAVEVTKLSLLLKVLEGENQESLQRQLRLYRERALPDLADNIKCGNSLIGPDFYQGKKLDLFDEEERLRINVFDWHAEFPHLMQTGGFDAVVGNPPYVNAWVLFEDAPRLRDYINESGIFATAERHWDLYILFLERALQVARDGSSRVSFIIPFSYAIQKYARASRNLVLKTTRLESVADLRTVRVFGRVPVITIIPVINKRAPSTRDNVEIRSPGPEATKYHAGTITTSHKIAQRRFLEQGEEMLRLDLSDMAYELCKRVDTHSVTVGEVCYVNYGAQMSSRQKGKFGKEFVLRDEKETETCYRTVSGRDLYRYNVTWGGKYVEWGLADQMYGARHRTFFEKPKLMIRDITGTHRLELTVDRTSLFCDHTILCAQRAVDASWKELPHHMVVLSERYSLDLLLALLGSRLVSAYYYWTLTGEGVRSGGGFHTYPKTIRALPVFDIESASATQTSVLGKLESSAARFLESTESRKRAKTAHERKVVERQIEATDREIDALVYELYVLSDEEIRIVEVAAGQ